MTGIRGRRQRVNVSAIAGFRGVSRPVAGWFRKTPSRRGSGMGLGGDGRGEAWFVRVATPWTAPMQAPATSAFPRGGARGGGTAARVRRAPHARRSLVRLGHADAGYGGPRVAAAGPTRAAIVRERAGRGGGVVRVRCPRDRGPEGAFRRPCPRRGAARFGDAASRTDRFAAGVERPFARGDRDRRSARDFDPALASAEGFFHATAALLPLRGAARSDADPGRLSHALMPGRARVGGAGARPPGRDWTA